jgi:uncharacterized membrane protein
MSYAILKTLHILSATLLFGTGLGTAFYMFCANRSGDVRAIVVVSRYVVLADWIFTTPSVIFQPISGYYLVVLVGVPLTATWVWASIALYVLAGICWLPVVWLQIRMRDLALEANAKGQDLPALFWRYERIWTLLGIPAFTAVVGVFFLMVLKPA